MTPNESVQLAERWVLEQEASIREDRRSDLSESIETVLNFNLDGDSEPLWQFILASYRLEMSAKVFAILAAGPLEDLLADFGPSYIDRVEKLARQDPKFNELLGGVWKNTIEDEVWERVTRIRNSVW